MRETLYNQRFDDIYFSPEDGLAETRHVFLQGNDLPERWQGQQDFTIAETGFGTGLNFLAAWQLFDETAPPEQRLHFVSFELYPLSREEISGALDVWREVFGARLDAYLAHYPLRTKGFHRIVLGGGRITLTLIFDDVNEALPQLSVPRGVDAWFLDGFAPAKNPQMWTQDVYDQMARLSSAGAGVATFTVAGHVRRGLEQAGFDVAKQSGYGRKREMTAGRFVKDKPPQKTENNPERIAIIGGGLAGTSCAHALRHSGVDITLFEAADHIAAGASGNETGLYNPRFSMMRSAESDFYSSAYALAMRTMEEISKTQDIGFQKCGALHLINSPEKEKRFNGMVENWGWHKDHVKLLDAEAASQESGVEVDKAVMFLPDSGAVSPRALCEAYAGDIDVRLNTAIDSIVQDGGGWQVNGEHFDAVIVACGAGALSFPFLSWLPVHTVRGQVSKVQATELSKNLKCNVCYGGYLSVPLQGGQHMLGATFQKWLDDPAVTDEDHQANLDNLAGNLPALAQDMAVTDGRASFRTASRDRFPIIGQAADENENDLPNLYVSTGHGSHGILSSLAGAYLISDLICGQVRSLPQRSIDALNGCRFLQRARRKQEK